MDFGNIPDIRIIAHRLYIGGNASSRDNERGFSNPKWF